MNSAGSFGINGINGQVGVGATRNSVPKRAEGASFQNELESVSLRFTKHAEERMRRRNILLESRDLNRLEAAVKAAESKGATNTLVLMDGLALIVNVATRNVVTAFDRNGMKEGVITNIDSTVIVRDQ